MMSGYKVEAKQETTSKKPDALVPLSLPQPPSRVFTWTAVCSLASSARCYHFCLPCSQSSTSLFRTAHVLRDRHKHHVPMDSSAHVSASATATRTSLTFDSLLQHIQRLIKEEQDDSSDASLPDPRPQQRVDQARVNQFQAITATLNAALTHHYPLRPWHKSAIRRYINDVMDALDHFAVHTDRHTSEAVTPTSRSPTRSPTKAYTMLNKSPTRIMAYQTAHSARLLDKEQWDYLCSSISEALRVRCTMRRSTGTTNANTEKRLCFFINEFLDHLQESRSTF